MVERKKDPVTGKFTSDSEPNDKFFALRLSESLLLKLKQSYGDKAAAFIREAIAEKLEREGKSCSQSSDCETTAVVSGLRRN